MEGTRHEPAKPAKNRVHKGVSSTTIIFELGGIVTLATKNKGRWADRWMTHLQGKKHLQPI